MKTYLRSTTFILLISFCTFSSNAQIVYTDVNPNDTIVNSNLDLNADGISDYIFSGVTSTSTCNSLCGGLPFLNMTWYFNPLNSNFVLGNSSTDISPQILSLSNTISAASVKWSSTVTGHTLIQRKYHCGIGGCINSPITNAWKNVSNKFIGLKFYIGSELHYGWVRISVIVTGSTYYTVKIIVNDYAYNAMPNQPILAGETSCTAPSVSISKNGSLSFCAGDSVSLTANGTGYQYQWKMDNVNIVGAINKTLVAKSAGAYKCKVTNSCGSKFSGIKTVTTPCRTTDHEEPFEISEEPEIAVTCNCHVPGYGCGLNEACQIACHSICHPVNYCAYSTSISASDSLTFCTGDSVKLTASRTGASSYQWQKDTVNIPGATTKTITVFSSGSYRCRATNTCNTNTSSAKTIIAELLPTITVTKNGPLSFCAGDSVVFTAVTTAHYFQWKKNNSNIAGATFQSYTAKSAGAYKCKVTNSCGSKSSGIKTVTIPCRNAIENFSEIIEHLLVYPNPATNSVTIKFPSEEPGEIQIANLFGQIISSEKVFSDEMKIDVSKFPQGLYVVRWNSGENHETKTFSIIK